MIANTKRYSWMSYTSIILGIFLLLILGVFFAIPEYTALEFIIGFLMIVGVPFNLILSIVTLMKKDEKKPLAILGLIFSMIVLGFIILFLFVIFG